MIDQKRIEAMRATGRRIEPATSGDEDLGPLQHLPGTWKNEPSLPGRGWNMIALPFSTAPDTPFNYRLLVNQYNETLKFSLVDKGVPNRGIEIGNPTVNTDQLVVTIDYEQMIQQIAADDSPNSGLAGGVGLPIHHEPGLWLHMTNFQTDGLDIARLATIPHGDSVLALGRSSVAEGASGIPVINGLPIGGPTSLDHPYLAPYKHFRDNLFEGLFDPTLPNALLDEANKGVDIVRTTTLEVDTTMNSGGIKNIPFIVKQANAAEMKSTFWIQELAETGPDGKPKLRMQYSQIVMLDFFPRRDGLPGLIRWPHVSINTMEKVEGPTETMRIEMPVS